MVSERLRKANEVAEAEVDMGDEEEIEHEEGHEAEDAGEEDDDEDLEDDDEHTEEIRVEQGNEREGTVAA